MLNYLAKYWLTLNYNNLDNCLDTKIHIKNVTFIKTKFIQKLSYDIYEKTKWIQWE